MILSSESHGSRGSCTPTVYFAEKLSSASRMKHRGHTGSNGGVGAPPITGWATAGPSIESAEAMVGQPAIASVIAAVATTVDKARIISSPRMPGSMVVVDWIVRGYGPVGWMFAFFIFFGAPVWLGCLGAGWWIAKGLVVDARFLSASRVRQGLVVVALWAHLLSLTLFCWFLADGGDSAAWQSPVSKILGVDSEGSAAPEWLEQMSEIGLVSMPAAALSMLAAWAAYMGRPLLRARPRPPSPNPPSVNWTADLSGQSVIGANMSNKNEHEEKIEKEQVEREEERRRLQEEEERRLQ
ncbi:hypothetical protein ACFVJ5_02720 [Nocardia sp. NPDC127606]|uniref:hypothetical protein n=1 Tax=Nocardia sp. NPDC127606 TaxID=3345406 RepID=UPI003636A182